MSSDPLLTTLCSICRTQPPRYKCPRCNASYCSVPCNRRHRARADCSGIRDVTAFVPKSKLCTESGIDRDYNFLQRIETVRFSTVKHVVDERGVLRQGDVKARVLGEEPGVSNGNKNNGKYKNHKGNKHKNNSTGSQSGRQDAATPALQKQWQGEELRYVPTRPRMNRNLAGDKGGDDEADDEEAAIHAAALAAAAAAPTQYEVATSHRVRALCRRRGITLLGAPWGLARQRANNTTVATERGAQGGAKQTTQVHLHWQVEWFLYEQKQNGSPNDLVSKPTCVLRRLLDNVPMFRAYVALVAWRRKQASAATAAAMPAKSRLLGEVEEVDVASVDDGEEMDARADGDDGEITSTIHHRKKPTASRPAPSPAEGSPDSNSFFYSYNFQNPDTGAWHLQQPVNDDDELDEEHIAAKYNLRYFLLRPRAPGVAPDIPGGGVNKTLQPMNELIPLDSSDTLSTALAGRTVLEFPTIYVLPATADSAVTLPPGFILGSTARRDIEAETNKDNKALPPKRPWDEGRGTSSNGVILGGGDPRDPKKRKTVQFATGVNEEDDIDDDVEMDSETSSSGESSEEEEDDSEDEDEENEDSEFVEGGLKALPPLLGVGSIGIADDSALAGGKGKLVVYDSWSEGEET